MSLTSIAASLAAYTAPALFTPSQTQGVAFTTPFVRPTDCREIWQSTTTISEDTTFSPNTTTYAIAVIYSDPARPEYSSCQPLGWANRIPSQRHDYEPAVCPSGWWALDMATTIRTVVPDNSVTNYPRFSTAYCCK